MTDIHIGFVDVVFYPCFFGGGGGGGRGKKKKIKKIKKLKKKK
jgi:hypothetical protein